MKIAKNINFRNRAVIICLLAAAVLSVALISAAIAKYVQHSEGDQHPINPEKYEFSCDYVNGKQYLQMTDSLSIPFSVVDISGEPSVKVAKAGGDEVTLTKTDWDGVKTYNYVANLTDPAPGDEYTVTIKSDTKYAGNTISFQWIFVAPEDYNYYTVTKHSNRIELDLYIGTTPIDLSINYSTLSPDNLHELMHLWVKNPSGATEVVLAQDFSANTHYELIFFGDTSKYSITEVAAKTPIDPSGEISFATPIAP